MLSLKQAEELLEVAPQISPAWRGEATFFSLMYCMISKENKFHVQQVYIWVTEKWLI
jgi:hypothetical protein